MFGKVTNANRVIVTNHAKERVLQRGKLFLSANERVDIRQFLISDFKKSALDLQYIFSPFMKHKIECRYGVGSFISYSKIFKYMGKYDHVNDSVVIISVYLKSAEKFNKTNGAKV